MILRDYIRLFRRWWWLLVLLTLAGALLGFILTLLLDPMYEAHTTLLINPSAGVATDAEAIIQGERLAPTYVELLQQRQVLDNVIQELSLPDTVQELARRTQVTAVPNTNLIEVRVRASTPALAGRIANALVQVAVDRTDSLQSVSYGELLNNLQAELALLQQDINRLEAEIEAAGPNEDTTQLNARLTQYRNSYTLLLDRYAETRQAQAEATSGLYIVEPAATGERVNNVPLAVALGGILGLMAAAGTVFVSEYLDDTVKTPDEVGDIMAAPTVGVIENVDPLQQQRHVLLSSASSYVGFAEAYRGLRTNVLLLTAETPLRSVLVTSSSRRDGKTTTAANLAITLARNGNRVLLVDLDVQHPQLHRLFNASNDQGVSTALVSLRLRQNGAFVRIIEPGNGAPEAIDPRQPDLAPHTVPTPIDNLTLMPSGPRLAPDPSDLLNGDIAADFVDELEALADIVVIDSAAVGSAAESLLLARACDVTILVVAPGLTTATDLRLARERLALARVPQLGMVLNKVQSTLVQQARTNGAGPSGWEG